MKRCPALMHALGTLLILACAISDNQAAASHDHHPSINDPADVAAFLDGVMLSTMDEHKAAGAAVSLIRNGELAYLKGYGYADLESRIPVDPERTLFRIGSISKLFTWLAVLQQYEAGAVCLDDDINEYLEGFAVPATYDEPVTLRSIMSHTPGFEDVLLRLFVREDDTPRDLEEILSRQMPRRIMPPLREAAYSNHGSGLAQYVVETVSGMPFETYAEEKILHPLGMSHSTFRQPLPEHLRPHLANGYAYQDGMFRKRGFEVVPMTGAGGASATAADMAIFMKALMEHGSLGPVSLMDSATFAIMKEPVLCHAAGMNPALHGFLDMGPRHLRIIGHGGNTFLFHSLLALFPEHGTGLFVTFSGEGAGLAYRKVAERFSSRYFPAPPPPESLVDLEQEYLEGFAGRYISNRRPHSDILKIIGLMNTAEISVSDNKLLYTDFFGKTHQATAIDSTTFYLADNETLIAFERLPGEKAQKLYFGNFPMLAAHRAGWKENISMHLSLFVIILACIGYVMVVWPWLHFARKLYDKKPRTRHQLPFFSQVTAWFASFFLLAFYLAVFLSAGGTEIVFGLPLGIRLGLIFPILALPFILVMAVGTVYIWKMPQVKNLSKLFYSIATIAFILAVWQLHFFNMLGWKY